MIRLLRRTRAAIVLIATFLFDLLTASLKVASIVLSSNDRTHPAIVPVPVSLKTPWGVALLAYFTSVTPGSTCLHVAADRRHIYIHMLHAPSDEEAANHFKHLYERWILELEK